MDPSIINNRMVEEAEEFVITWGKAYRGKTMDECSNSYLRFIAEKFNGIPARLAENLLLWREKNSVHID